MNHGVDLEYLSPQLWYIIIGGLLLGVIVRCAARSQGAANPVRHKTDETEETNAIKGAE